MKRFIVGAMALLFAAAGPAVAADHRHGGHPAAHAHRPAAHVRVHRHVTVHRSVNRPAHRSTRHVTHRRAHRPLSHSTRHAVRREARHTARHAVRQDIRRSTARYAKVRRAVHAKRRFHAGVYRRPHGWYHHHWRIGQRLPRGWFVRNYWITDWQLYGLWAPVDGLIWVRVGPDAMLIDPATGQIVAADYGIFW